MTRSVYRIALLAALLYFPAAQADHVTLSGEFDGTEARIAAFPGTCDGAGDLQYEPFQAVQVSMNGNYSFTDASNSLPGDVVIGVYDGSFDPQNPSMNRLAAIDEGEPVGLSTGQDYIVVVQSWCSNAAPVVYAVAIAGPGAVTGPDVVQSPDHTLGVLDAGDPTADFFGVTRNYELSGPLQVPHNGLYWFADASVLDGRNDILLLVYDGPFNPADVTENLIAQEDDSGTFVLESGKDYYFVVIPFFQGSEGEWHWVLFPPGPLKFNAGMMGAWVNSDTLGQGILIDVFTDTRLVFLAWFTFDLEAADGSVIPMIGGAGQRWFTAFGRYQEGDRTVSLSIENSTGGAFDSAEPPVETDSSYGTGELEFIDCLNAIFNYNIPSGPVSGVVSLGRVANDHLELCSVLGSSGPGVISG